MRERGPNGKFPVRMPNLVYGTRIDKSPFFESTTNAGCTDYTVYNKMLMPIAWDGVTPEEEYWARKSRSGSSCISRRAKLLLFR